VVDRDVRATAEPILVARGLRKSFGDQVALDGVDLEIRPGEIVGLLGPNGAGKTTLISLIAGLLTPDAGSICVGGIDVSVDPIAVRSKMGVAPQELSVYLQLSVLNNLRFFGELFGVTGSRLRDRIDEVASALELDSLLERKANELSGGEKRRLHTAVALLHDAPLVLLDEPTAGVDVHTRNRLLEAVKSMASNGTAICYTTHYLQEIENIAAGATILDDGKVIAAGTTKDLITSFASTVIEIRIAGGIPSELAKRGVVEDSLVRIQAEDPGAELRHALAIMRDATDRIRSIEIVEPSLESVYVAITGRRIERDPHPPVRTP
jgi:ABC-2 type transport system ATP-binding protein